MKMITFINRLFLAIYILAVGCLTVSAQDEFIRPPASLETQGVPPIPASLAKSIAPYTSVYGMPLAGWDPVKREIWVKGRSTATWLSRIETPGSPQKIWKYMKSVRIKLELNQPNPPDYRTPQVRRL